MSRSPSAVSTIAHPTASYAPATTSYAAAPASYTASYAPAAMTYAAPTYAAPTYAAPTYAAPTYAAPTYAGPATTYAAPATTSYVPVASAPTYILQAVVPAIAQVEPCHAEIAEDAETALLVLTFCPKPLDDADRKKLMEALEKKAEADRKKTALQLQEADEKALTAEKEFWDGTVPVEDKKAGIATGKDITQIGQAYHRANSLCQVLKARIKNFHPADVKPDGSGTRSYMFEIEEDPNVSDFDKEEAKKKDLVLGAKKIKNNVDPKMWEKLNELMKIPGLMEVKRSYGDNDAELKKLGFPDITFDSDIALAECQCAKHIEAHALTTKVAEVEASVRVAEESMAMKTQFAAEAVQAEVENEQKIYKLEDAVRALKKEKELHIQLKTDTASTDKNLVKTQDDLEKAKAAMAQCSAKVQKCNDECRAAKSTLSGLQFDLEHAVEKADKFRAQVPDTCELFHTMEVPAFCQNECGFSGGKAELAIHSRSCNYKGHVCDADDCDFKDTFANVEAHEKECAKYKKLQRALKTGMGAYTTPVYTISPPVSYYSAPMAYPAAPVSYGTQVVPITGTPSTITGTPSTVAQPTGKQI